MDDEFKYREVAFFSKLLAEKQGISVDAAQLFIKKFFDLIAEGLLHDNYVHVKGLGSFKVITKETETNGVFSEIVFVPEEELQSLINKPFEHFESVVVSSDLLKDQLREEQKEKSSEEVELKKDEKTEEIREDEGKNRGGDSEENNKQDNSAIETTELIEDDKREEVKDNRIECGGDKSQKVNTNQEELMGNKEKEVLGGEQRQPSQNVEDSFIEIYRDESKDDVVKELESQEKIDATLDQEEIETIKKLPDKKSSMVGMLVFIIVILSLLVLLLAFRLFSIKRELDIYVEHRTEAKAFEGVTDDTIILYPEESDTNKEEVYDDSEGIFEEDLIDNQASLKNIEDTDVVDTYKIPSRASLAYTITGTKTTHQVASGETLRIIAEFYFGSRD
ncbi:MAG: HU family DNA-binding protein, partial [Bacteroidaceae bacterium]